MNGLLRAGSVAVIVGALVFAGRSFSETKKPPVPPRTRIAMFNLSAVVKAFEKYQSFQAEIQEDIARFKKQDADIREEVQDLTKALEDKTLPEEQRKESEKKLTSLKRAIEDNNAEAKALLGKKSDEQMVLLYKEVSKAAEQYAKSHDIELVMHYNDADRKNDAEYSSAANVARKMQAGAFMPMYATPGIDITAELALALNKDYSREK
jgi:Skp family chaperone for outer membrane proteins